MIVMHRSIFSLHQQMTHSTAALNVGFHHGRKLCDSTETSTGSAMDYSAGPGFSLCRPCDCLWQVPIFLLLCKPSDCLQQAPIFLLYRPGDCLRHVPIFLKQSQSGRQAHIGTILLFNIVWGQLTARDRDPLFSGIIGKTDR